MSSLPRSLDLKFSQDFERKPVVSSASSTEPLVKKDKLRRSTGYHYLNPKDLFMSGPSLVKNRTGSVLARQTILKADHFETELDTQLDFSLHGAPNFRLADLNIYGVAQPTYSGIATALTLLHSHRKRESIESLHSTTYWFSAREEPLIYLNQKPFVLRDAERPFQNMKTFHGISASRLEAMEARLKDDVLRESQRWNGLFLIHEEKNERMVPAWLALDQIQTPKEVFDSLIEKGFSVVYVRIPISPEQAPEDRYIDTYVEAIRKTSTMDHLVFNCGMGVGRTTFAMVVAMLIRRAQIIQSGAMDPFGSLNKHDLDENAYNKSMLRLVYLLDKALSSSLSSKSVIEWTLARGHMIEDLRNALLGNYVSIQQLIPVLKKGNLTKDVLDEAIDRCAVLSNLREEILLNRVKYTTTGESPILDKATGLLERYFFLLAFSSYVEEPGSTPFSEWLQSRSEIWNMLQRLRRKGPSLTIFRPADDLSVFSSELAHSRELLGWGPAKGTSDRNNVTEMDKHVIKSRKGNVLGSRMILKMDYWAQSSSTLSSTLHGASNFRKIPRHYVYGVAQPTLRGLTQVLHALEDAPKTVFWLNLREEPLIYINGVPYVLRDQYVTLRNIKSYSGITPDRLESIENKLRDDVVAESLQYEGQILIHTESTQGKVHPVWEECRPECVQTLSQVMDMIAAEEVKDAGLHDHPPFDLIYKRVPLTAESRPDPGDFDAIQKLLSSIDIQTTAVVINCQIGVGRSTTGTIVASLVLNWLQGVKTVVDVKSGSEGNYQIIHSILRVIRNGLECKRMVDKVIDDCGMVLNLRQSIEECRQSAEAETDPDQKKLLIHRGILNLNRYFLLILFQSYLDQNEPGVGRNLVSFGSWLKSHPEFDTIRDETEGAGLAALTPVAELKPGDGLALSNEVLEVVNTRSGAVLAQGTIIKFDLFPGAQKLSLPERVEGAPNFRKIPLGFVKLTDPLSSLDLLSPPHVPSWGPDEIVTVEQSSSVCGVGMPTKDGIRKLLSRIDAGPNGTRTTLWTSLREEPVIYINGRAYVLRLLQDPVKNLEATGIARERVELMEDQLRDDLILDMARFGGRLLLHEERIEGSSFSIVPVWETVKRENIQTPLEVYSDIVKEGYRVDYLRIPITDEQAPIPNVFNQLVQRLLTVSSTGDAIFNCQMGRGRTTTGMVISCLMQMIVGNRKHLDNPDFAVPDSLPDVDMDASTFSLAGQHDSQVELQLLFRAGEYKIIMQLISVLQYGKLAKKLTDKAIDLCDHMQNLRLAIDDYRVRLSALESTSKKYQNLHEVACNYLVRYFYLITFADYLIEEWATWTPVQEEFDIDPLASIKPKSFSVWLEDRREILNIIRRSNQTLD